MATQPQLIPAEVLDQRKPPKSDVALSVTTPMDLLAIAIQKESAIDVIERLAALQEKAMARNAEVEFNQAMNSVQAEIGPIAPDLSNPQTRSKYASYAALDRVIRPIYTRHGFSLSFDTAEATQPEMIRSVCHVSHRGGHTRRYQVDIPADGKGAKGGDVMTKTHAAGAAMSYGMRYLLKYIFNVAIGEEDKDGNGGGKLSNLAERLEWIANSRNTEELRKIYDAAYKAAEAANDAKALTAIIQAKNAKYKELTNIKRGA